MQNLYCVMIHGGLSLTLLDNTPYLKSCCLRNDPSPISDNRLVWNHPSLTNLRRVNQSDQWDPGCSNCENLEKSGLVSMRQGNNFGFNKYSETDFSGPIRIDIMFDSSCNLACRTCGPNNSTFWQKHLKENGRWTDKISSPKMKNDVIEILDKLDLSNLRQVVFNGGETLLGQEYWDLAGWLVDQVPNSKENLDISFQTNGTQSIDRRNHRIIENLRLFNLHVSLDGVGEKFEYLRWPASWNQVTDNILELQETLPDNAHFLIEQTISVFNVLYLDEIKRWINENFPMNRDNYPVICTDHLANGIYGLENASTELVEKVKEKSLGSLINPGWSENPDRIYWMMQEIQEIDSYRQQDFRKFFPEMAEAYRRFC